MAVITFWQIIEACCGKENLEKARVWREQQDRKVAERQRDRITERVTTAAQAAADLNKCTLEEYARLHNSLSGGKFPGWDQMKEELIQSEGPYYGAIGGAYTFIITPTSLGTVVKIEHAVTKETLDLTDYDGW